jgi:hypothetical protein
MEGSSVLSDSKLKMRGIDFGKKKRKKKHGFSLFY